MGSQTPSRASTTTWCHAVAEISREDFPELGVRHDETDRTGGMVGAPFQFRMDPHQVLLPFHFIPKRVVVFLVCRRQGAHQPLASILLVQDLPHRPYLKQLTCDSYPMLAH